ncbi:hypothetical protein PR002_g2193 [Phytophthora rubi]|uniref:Uncharacterized protein n=1 Tax=Phytophthora rubi TaxID=129364 RepID=A0A6A3NJB2_9STRA|nr:hypothetical protein PR002_g2193 [Phytophthora rubi]
MAPSQRRRSQALNHQLPPAEVAQGAPPSAQPELPVRLHVIGHKMRAKRLAAQRRTREQRKLRLRRMQIGRPSASFRDDRRVGNARIFLAAKNMFLLTKSEDAGMN